jgi:hypothetical protein
MTLGRTMGAAMPAKGTIDRLTKRLEALAEQLNAKGDPLQAVIERIRAKGSGVPSGVRMLRDADGGAPGLDDRPPEVKQPEPPAKV